MSAADRLKAARIAAGYSTAKAAANALGIKRPGYTHHETGRCKFSLERAILYAREFGTSPEWLLYGRGEAVPPPVPLALRDQVARMIALHGLGTADGSTRACPPNEKWDQDEWERRILECVPSLVEVRCRKLADEIIALAREAVWP